MYTNYKQQFESELKEIRDAGTWKEEGVIEGKQGAEIRVIDKSDINDKIDKNRVKSLLNFCGNNYLGLASTDELAQAAIEGVQKYGYGMASVRFICGTSTIHKDLEAQVCKFFGTEDTILYTSCFDANTGLFETILKEGDAIFSDELNHASIIDGVRLCKAERFRFKNSDMADLEAKLQEFTAKINPSQPPLQQRGGDTASAVTPSFSKEGVGGVNERVPRMLIATDGVFSMDGITAKLKEICDLADKYRALVMVDDSHASGVLGKTGRGSIEQAGVMGRVDILTSTFGKALGGAGGGFTTGRKEIIQVLHQRSRTTLFSNALPPMIASAALYVLQNFDSPSNKNNSESSAEALAKADGLNIPKRLNQLKENTSYFRGEMEKLGFTLGGDGKHAITPVMLFEEKLAADMARALFAKGIYVRGFTYPVVPKGKARIRVQISAAHNREQMDRTVQAFAEVGKKFGILK